MSQRQQGKRAELYILATYGEVERVAPACTKSDVLVWLHLRSIQRVKGSKAWVWANLEVLRSWGVQRRSYQRALINLAKADLLEVDPQPGRTTRVRLKPIEPAKR